MHTSWLYVLPEVLLPGFFKVGQSLCDSIGLQSTPLVTTASHRNAQPEHDELGDPADLNEQPVIIFPTQRSSQGLIFRDRVK
jgi:hypothetical protein